MTRLIADFNMIDEEGRIWLPSAETADVHRGERVVLTDGEVELDATLGYDFGRAVWLGIIDPSTARQVHTESGLPTAR
jgi:hypothetical protein